MSDWGSAREFVCEIFMKSDSVSVCCLTSDAPLVMGSDCVDLVSAPVEIGNGGISIVGALRVTTEFSELVEAVLCLNPPSVLQDSLALSPMVLKKFLVLPNEDCLSGITDVCRTDECFSVICEFLEVLTMLNAFTVEASIMERSISCIWVGASLLTVEFCLLIGISDIGVANISDVPTVSGDG